MLITGAFFWIQNPGSGKQKYKFPRLFLGVGTEINGYLYGRDKEYKNVSLA